MQALFLNVVFEGVVSLLLNPKAAEKSVGVAKLSCLSQCRARSAFILAVVLKT